MLITGVVKLLPVPTGDPPVAEVYQFNVVPGEPVADKTTVPGPHLVAGVVESNCGLLNKTVTTLEVSPLPAQET